jgi:mRNA-degrading endonuclease RelE of RelBE toxin-antitoxin system
MNWVLHIRNKARKALRHFPKKDQYCIAEAFREMKANPFFGDIVKLDEKSTWRQRIGSYRIFYEIITQEKVIYIFRVERRTLKTY